MKHLAEIATQRGDDFGIYVHWPFCESKCPYCDFNSHVAGSIDQSRWAKGYSTEIKRYSKIAPDRIVTSIFFGGGTPSLMEPKLVDTILTEIRSHWRLSNSVEITLEANPGSVERSRFQGYRNAGVNRASLGIQALNDESLHLLGRRHSRSDALAAIEIATETFDRVSIDLIYARQNQTISEWEAELLSALKLGTEHISLYQLTIEEGTAFHQRQLAGKLPGLPDEDLAADMYLRTIEICAEHGLNDYEVSNLAVPGAESRHNKTYWNSLDYLGIGPGAHGRLTLGDNRFATECHSQPGKWLQEVEGARGGESLRYFLSPDDRLKETLIMGLRLKEGVNLGKLLTLGFSDTQIKRVKALKDAGFLLNESDTIATTLNGRMLLNRLLQEIV
jgi:oxygen-independent coproporphyrinogen-3 oxidase